MIKKKMVAPRAAGGSVAKLNFCLVAAGSVAK